MLDLFPPTEQQLAVINHRGSNVLVLAGPGTGKTETLARRFASLVADGVPANQILVLTFSRRAAEEMRDRILLRLRQLRGTSLAVSELFVKTFHSFCARLLDGDDVRMARRALLTPVKERLLWRRLMRAGTLDFESFDRGVVESSQFATDCLNIIGQLKGRGIAANHFAALARSDPRLRDVAMVFERMEFERERLDLHDYRDLVNEAERELRAADSKAARWLRGARFQHILVDEFQDSDPMQLRLLEAMRAGLDPEPCFCFVGDKNQSIYRFRGASPDNVDRAAHRFACTTLLLHDNRRSAPVILAVANADDKLDDASKTKAADPTKAGAIRFVRPRSLEDEVQFLCDAIGEKIAAGTAPRAIAVLLRRTRPYQQLVISALREAGIPVAVQPTAGFHEDALIDGVLTALRLLASPLNPSLWQRMLTNPIVGYRPIDVCFAFDAGRRSGISDPHAMLTSNPPQGVRSIHNFLDAWRRCVQAYDRGEPLALLQTIVHQLDLLRPVREGARVDGFDLDASPARLQTLLQAAEDYREIEGGRLDSRPLQAPLLLGRSSDIVAEFMEHLDETVALLEDANQPPANAVEGVRVISIHAAKGLEFDFVAIPELLEGILPASERPNRLLSRRSITTLRKAGADIFVDDDEARSEEHSLWYVALTRARSEVLATAAQVDDDSVDLQASSFAKAIEEVEPGAICQSPPTGGMREREAICQSPPTGGMREREAICQSPPTAVAPVKLPIEALSPSSISNFVACPRRFYYGDVLRLPRRDDDATIYGRRLHTILRRFHEIETDFEHVDDPLVAAARYERTLRRIIVEEDGFGEIGLSPQERFERDDLTQRLAQYASALAQEARTSPFRVLACERPVASSFDGLTIRGMVDRIDRLASGELVIRDYKSGRCKGPLATSLRNAFEQLDSGETLFGDAPEGLNLQTILYIPGVEEAFGAGVRRLDYLYFRGKGAEDSRLRYDSTEILDSDAPSTDADELSRHDIARARRDIAVRIVELCGNGSMAAFSTALDERTCMFCDFVRICPGAGAIPA